MRGRYRWRYALVNWLGRRLVALGARLDDVGYAIQRCPDCGRSIMGAACKNTTHTGGS